MLARKTYTQGQIDSPSKFLGENAALTVITDGGIHIADTTTGKTFLHFWFHITITKVLVSASTVFLAISAIFTRVT